MTLFSLQSDLELYLEKEGFTPLLIGGCPCFQIEANHISGISIYFRSYNNISIEVYNVHLDFFFTLPTDQHLLYEYDLDLWKDVDLECLNFSEALYVLYWLWNDIKEVFL